MPILRPHPLEPLAQSFEGLIGIECFERIANPGKVMAISYWRAAQSVERGRKPEIRR
jgi:heme-degrading monooxygenase HmoA